LLVRSCGKIGVNAVMFYSSALAGLNGTGIINSLLELRRK
jgi:hypothetical protein